MNPTKLCWLTTHDTAEHLHSSVPVPAPCTIPACLVVLTAVRGPEGQAPSGSWRAFWHYEAHGSPEEPQSDTDPEWSHSPEFPFQVNFPISVHLLLHTISTSFFLTSRVPLLCFSCQPSWLWLHISSVSVSQRHKKHETGILVYYGRKILSKNKGQILQWMIRDCKFWCTDHLNIGKYNVWCTVLWLSYLHRAHWGIQPTVCYSASQSYTLASAQQQEEILSCSWKNWVCFWAPGQCNGDVVYQKALLMRQISSIWQMLCCRAREALSPRWQVEMKWNKLQEIKSMNWEEEKA